MISLVSSGMVSRAVIFSRTWSALDAPVMTVETFGFLAHHASENCARVTPNSSAITLSSLTFLLRPSSVNAPFSHS